MKKIIILFTLLVSITINVYSQTGSDYYIPLCVGNYVSFYTPESGNYGARKSVYHIKQSDVVSGEIAYLEEAYEIGDYSPNDTSIFRQFWLRKDASGNILLVAIDMNGTGLIADAYILPVPHLYFPNNYLTLGYTRSFVFGEETTYDTVISVSATVGSYTNCIVVRETSVSDSVNVIDEYYYAPSAGLVKLERLYHRGDSQAYVGSLTDILAYNCYVGLQTNELVDNISTKLYPNPASDILNLDIENSDNKLLTVNIYNAIGTLVKTLRISKGNNQIDVSGFINGVYLMTLNSDNFSKNQKLVINK